MADQIFRELRHDIFCGVVPRGAKLPSDRELAQRYQVSNPTVREAVRGLSLFGLVDVRHGSGAYVTADSTSLVALSLAGVIQLANLGVDEILSVLGVLNEQAAVLAAQEATADNLATLQDGLVALDRADSPDGAAKAVRAFHGAIAGAAHNPLLTALCDFLVSIQVELAIEMNDGSMGAWRKMLSRLRPARTRLVAGIVDRDRDGVGALAREFHRKAVTSITSLPKAKEARLRDPALRRLLSAMMDRIGPA